jgi:hypothetical protein
MAAGYRVDESPKWSRVEEILQVRYRGNQQVIVVSPISLPDLSRLASTILLQCSYKYWVRDPGKFSGSGTSGMLLY